MSFFKSPAATTQQAAASDDTIIDGGSLKYTAEAGANSSLPTYQEASGAPIEVNSPLGYSAGHVTLIFINISKMVGTGVFSTRADIGLSGLASSVLSGTGSVGLALFYWVIGFAVASSMLSVYLEFSSYFPSRSGSEAVYLEQAYPRPRYFFPTVFAMQTVIFSFSSSNSIVLANYLFRLAEASPSDWQLKGVAVASYTVAVLAVSFSTKWSLHLSNAIGWIKLATLTFIAITGLVVLGGNVSSIQDPTAHFRNAFSGSEGATVYGATNALVSVMFSYSGYENAFNLVNEVKNPTKTLKWSAPVSLLVTGILYMFANIAYFAAASKEEIINSEVNVASLFFENTFGSGGASRALNFLICISAFGNLLAVLIGSSRMLRECGRQGVLPFTKFWTSTRPFGTPLGPYFLKWVLTSLMVIAPPAGDAFNFIVNLGVYPQSMFHFLLAIGLLLIRRQRKRLNIPRTEWHAWSVVVYFAIVANFYLLVAPWYPPTEGANGGNVSFWYGTYVVVGISFIASCGVYYVIYIKVLPRFGNYAFRQTIISGPAGETAHKLVKVPNHELASWDEEHDAAGRLRRRQVAEKVDQPSEA
ncbi:amino acid permease-domain-containing protein [Aspergillus cavernicola]|uniref:Amino acid permease-domain-containing protein n=1 Tax=Aspergillus cavernicola TaxID=176166 RepID=A0ABR4IZ00_9EURO